MNKGILFFILILTLTVKCFAQSNAPITKIESVNICNGSTNADLVVTVDSFSNIGNINLTMAYDTAKLGLVSLLNLNTVFNSWGSNFLVNTGISGTITLAGYGPGVTLQNGDTIFTLHFAKSGPIINTTVSFFENLSGTSCEYSHDSPPLL